MRRRFFFVTHMLSSGSRVEIAQKPNNSGQILDQRWKILFCNYYEINSSQDFFLYCNNFGQQVLNPTPLNPTPATWHKRKRKLHCSFRIAALQKLHCNIGFSAMRKSFRPEAALQQAKNCTATSKKLRCRKVALSCRFPAGFKPPHLGTHV